VIRRQGRSGCFQSISEIGGGHVRETSPSTNRRHRSLSLLTLPVPTITMKVLFVFMVLEHRRREVLHFNVTEHPSAAGRPSRSSKPSPIRIRPGICSEIETASTATKLVGGSHHCRWNKCSPRPGVPGRIRTADRLDPQGLVVRQKMHLELRPKFPYR
jgi:hypothetical protein